MMRSEKLHVSHQDRSSEIFYRLGHCVNLYITIKQLK